MNLIFGTSVLLILIVAELIFLAKVEGEKLPWKEIVVNVNSGHIMLWLARAFVLLTFQFFEANLSFGWLGNLPIIAQWVFTVFAWDFCYYWSHRTHHEIPFLWNIHGVHHQGEHFNLSLGIRNSWYQPLTSLPFFLPLAIVGVTFEQFLLVSAFHYFIQFYNHNSLVNKSGFLEKILITPSHHRVHHGTNPEYIDRNHGGTFVFWDKLFGTFQIEKPDVEIKYGTLDKYNPENPFWANMMPFLQYFGINKKQGNTVKAKEIKLKDNYIVIGSLLLFLLLLIYVENEKTWEIPPLAVLFIIVFLGTVALGSIAQGRKIGLIFWIILAIPAAITFILMFQIKAILVLLVISGVVIHGLFGLYNLLAKA